MTATSVMIVVFLTSFADGQDTRFISARTSRKNCDHATEWTYSRDRSARARDAPLCPRRLRQSERCAAREAARLGFLCHP